MAKKIVFKVPPRPEVIRERYADFFEKQAAFLRKYKQGYVSGMKERFAIRTENKLRPTAD